MNRKLYRSAILELGGENSGNDTELAGLGNSLGALCHVELGIDIVGMAF
jgi:hypothetical protein